MTRTSMLILSMSLDFKQPTAKYNHAFQRELLKPSFPALTVKGRKIIVCYFSEKIICRLVNVLESSLRIVKHSGR